MTKKLTYLTCLSFLIFFFSGTITQPAFAQSNDVSIKGVVLESGTGLPLKQVSISVSSTGTSTDTDENGEFTIECPNNQVELIFNLPGYTIRNIFLNGRDFIQVSLVLSTYKSLDNSYSTAIGKGVLKDANYSSSALSADDIKMSAATSFDQVLQGRVPGLSVIQQSGMPGHKTTMNIRGISSIYGKSDPLLIIDGMIHDYSYANNSLMEGFSSNPFDIVDIDDIAEISIIKDGVSFLGAAGSNGIINVTTEQKSEASTEIKFSAYGGISLAPDQQNVMGVSQFKGYFSDVLTEQGYSVSDINSKYPWLNGPTSSEGYYKYNNNTNWQESILKPATLQKYHFFLKGGDDIATYNISTGYVQQESIYENAKYNRFNLRINGKINITDKFSITPNAKLSLANSYTPNQGYSTFKNPLTSSLLMPPIMAASKRDEESGVVLPYIDDVGGVFNNSNPVALVNSAMGTNVNYHFLSSMTAQYKISDHILLSTLFGIDFNNARESIFLPDLGVVQVDSASNSPGDFVNEFRSTQNHSTITYSNKTASGHSWVWQSGFRYMENSYKTNLAIDLNTPSDDFRSVGQGSKYNYLRTTSGDQRGLLWMSYFTSANYNFRNKYFLDVNASYDGNSALNSDNRYNLYPSVAGAWRISSERFMSEAHWLDDLKLRGSYSLSGNMFSNVYDYSKLYYAAERINTRGVLLREGIPNKNMELEKRATINAGLDVSLFKQATNIHLDVYQSSVDNLIIHQQLSPEYGYTSNYFDNGGAFQTNGIELSADTRVHIGDFIWTVGGSLTQQITEITRLDFIDPSNKHIITSIEGAEMITSVGNSLNAFYGYKTNGIFNSASDAAQITGPNKVPMALGDQMFVDTNNDNIIDDADKMIIGDPNPDLFGSFFTTFQFRRLALSAVFNYSMGNDIFNYVRYKTEGMDSYSNQSATVLDRWTATNPTSSMPRASIGDPTGNTAFSDRWIEDGSYVRLQKLTLSYQLPRASGFYKGLTLYVTATNLITFTDYSGNDPDFAYSSNPFFMGVDYGQIPQSKSFIMGLKLDL